jgi:hypothetical protein
MAKHRSFECKYQPATANKATIKDVNRTGKNLEHVTMKKSKANFTASQKQDNESDEDTRYQGSFGTKASEDNQVYSHFAHSTSAMNFSNMMTTAGSSYGFHMVQTKNLWMYVVQDHLDHKITPLTCNCS